MGQKEPKHFIVDIMDKRHIVEVDLEQPGTTFKVVVEQLVRKLVVAGTSQVARNPNLQELQLDIHLELVLLTLEDSKAVADTSSLGVLKSKS